MLAPMRAVSLALALLIGPLLLTGCGDGDSDVPPTAPPAPTLMTRGGAAPSDDEPEEAGEAGSEQDAADAEASDTDAPDRAAGVPLEVGDEIPDGTPVELMPRRSEPLALGSPEYAIQAFLWWRPENAERDLLLAEDMGFGFVKQIFGWRDIEPEPGVFDWEKTDFIVGTALRYGGVDLIVRLDFQPDWARSGCSDQGPPNDLQDYANYVGKVAERYRGQIAAYQIWNEPNLAREWCDQSPDPAAYAEMLRVAYAAIKAADPAAYVISAGLTPTGSTPPVAMPDDQYLDRLYQAMGGDSEGYFDLLGVHAAGFAAPPEVSPDEAAASDAYGGERFFTFRRVEDLRAIQERYGDGETRVAILEMGWTSDQVNPSYKWHAVSEETKAEYLVRAYQYAEQNWSPWISIMSTIYLCDADWTQQNEQYWWCVNNPDGTPRPAFGALKAMPK
jgi:hypothetical protein